MSNASVSQKAPRHTYFYVFADSQSTPQSQLPDETAEVTPDRAVQQAFERLSREQHSNATVYTNASEDLRRVLGIESLPAFAINDSELPCDGSLRDKPPNLPSIWKFRKRKRILESGQYVPKVEREIISLYKTSDSLYQFVRDLHLKNIDHGINAVSHKIENEVRKLVGRKAAKLIALTKQTVYK